MFEATELHIVLETARPLFGELQKQYQKLPPTRCQCRSPGICCVYLPEITLIEALQWVDILRQLPDPEKNDALRSFVSFYLTNPVQHSGCPFRQKDRCGIYEFRSFACRAYGLWSRSIGDGRTEQSRRGRRRLLAQWKCLGLNLPAEMVEQEIDYCDSVECVSRQAVSDERLIAILESIYRLDQNLDRHRKTFEEDYHSDFSFLVTSQVLGFRKAVLMNFAVIKEIVNQGRSKRMAAILDKVTAEVLV